MKINLGYLTYWTFILLLCGVKVGAQVQLDFGSVFPQNEVTVIRITIDQDSLNEMILNQENVHEYPASFKFESSTISDTSALIGFRLRGNTSLGAAKKSFKVSMNTFSNDDLFGVQKLNLISQQNDPSLIRSKICHDTFRHFGIASARTAYTQLYINNMYYGLYLNQEHIDENMTSSHFDEQGDGNLYKCTYPATLEYISDNPDDYKFALWGTRHYELKTNTDVDDYTDLAHFIDVLNNTPISNLQCELSRVFNVESYIKVAALDILLGNWDGYIYNKNNFYLYHNELTDQFNYIPYDLDNTLGIDWIGQDWTTRDIYNWLPQGEARPLFTKLMQIQEYRDRFSYYINLFCQDYFNPENMASIATSWQNLIGASVSSDTFYPLDYGFTPADFEHADSLAWGGHVAYSILDYVSQRKQAALQQLETYATQNAFVQWLELRRPPNALVIDALITGPQSDNCIIRTSINGIDFIENPILDVGGFSQVAGDQIYTFANESWPTGTDKYYYQIKLPDGSLIPCTPDFFWVTHTTPGLYINEVMTNNTNTISDENGQYEDWVELYNGTSATINLSGKFLTDDPANWNKFALPNLNIPSHGFLLLWLDDDTSQGNTHCNFKLSANEILSLYNVEDGEPRLHDEVATFPATSDFSWERIPDGGIQIDSTSNATPGYSNLASQIIILNSGERIRCFPNPAKDIIHFDTYYEHAELMDCYGKIIEKTGRSNSLNITSVESGSYLLKLEHTIVPIIIIH